MARKGSQGFHCILVPYDGSLVGEQAIPYAIAIAKRGQGEVRLALVQRELSPAQYLRAMSLRLREQLGYPISLVALQGPVVPALAEYARDSGADLVVMTTHGRGGLQRAWLGNVADDLIRTLNVPILALRSQEGAPLIEPVGFRGFWSRWTARIGGSGSRAAAKMAQLWNSQISLLRVVHPSLLSTDAQFLMPAMYDEGLTRRDCEAAREDLERRVESLRAQGLEAKALVVVARATAASILDLARPEQVSMIALATHGRGDFVGSRWEASRTNWCGGQRCLSW